MHYLYVDCTCGAHLVTQIPRDFEFGFLHDSFGIRARLGIPDLPLPFPYPTADTPDFFIDADVYIAWHAKAAAALAAHADELPTLYQIWLRTSATGKTGRAVYFEADGAFYSVFASLSPTIVARKLPDGWLHEKMLPAQKQSTGYVQTRIPRLANFPGRWLRPADDEGNIAMSVEGFEDLFAGTGVELEVMAFAYVFGRTIKELAGAAEHARGCGRGLRVRHV